MKDERMMISPKTLLSLLLCFVLLLLLIPQTVAYAETEEGREIPAESPLLPEEEELTVVPPVDDPELLTSGDLASGTYCVVNKYEGRWLYTSGTSVIPKQGEFYDVEYCIPWTFEQYGDYYLIRYYGTPNKCIGINSSNSVVIQQPTLASGTSTYCGLDTFYIGILHLHHDFQSTRL